MPRNKCGNHSVTIDGVEYASKREAARHRELLLLERAGRIQNLQTQVKFLLIPAQYAPCTEVYKSGPRKGSAKPGKLLEREVAYIADFVYTKDGNTIVEDAKGFRDPSSAVYAKFVLKRKMMLYFHSIRVQEV